MIEQIDLAGSFTLPGSAMTLNRMGYGAMQLAGRDGNKLVWGPPPAMSMQRSLFCERLSQVACTTSIRPIFMVPMSRTRSYEKRCTPTPTTW